jgi:3-hydroxybutyrate dehydrogenase
MLVGPAMTTRACLPTMRANGYGRVINIGSVHSLVASRFKVRPEVVVVAHEGGQNIFGWRVAASQNLNLCHFFPTFKNKSAYVAAKHGLVGFSKVVALETGDFDFTINTVGRRTRGKVALVSCRLVHVGP